MKYLAALEYMLFCEEVGKYRILSSSSMSSAYPHTTVAIFEWLSCTCLSRPKKFKLCLAKLEIHCGCSIASSQHQALLWMLCDLNIMKALRHAESVSMGAM